MVIFMSYDAHKIIAASCDVVLFADGTGSTPGD